LGALTVCEGSGTRDAFVALCAVALALVATAVLVAPPLATAKPYRVGINEGPGLNKGAGLTRLGPMWVRYSSSRPVKGGKWTLAYAVRSFGKPRSRVGAPGECQARWPNLGLTVGFRGHQADHEDGCRTPRDLYVSDARIAGRAAKSRFATKRGTRVGTTVKRLRRQYPGAVRSGNSWDLVRSKLCFGLTCDLVTSLVARIAAGRVVELRAANYAD
jgi:hypothetical protein